MSKILDGFSFGADPEVFIVDKKGKPVPAALAGIPGTKAEPFKVKDGAVQVDGMAAEFNITPCKSFADWNRRIVSVMEQMKAMIPEGHNISVVPYVVFDPEVFDKAPEGDKELGCSPDFDAWTGDVNPPPEFLENPYMRCAAGHIHVGWGNDFEMGDTQHILNCRDLVRQLDWYLGGWSTRLDSDPMRRNLYGKAGAFRPKPYGVEYRVLSNFWINNENRRLAVWNRMQNAIKDMRMDFMPDKAGEDNQRLIEAINAASWSKELASKYRYPISEDGMGGFGRRTRTYQVNLDELAA